MEKPKTSYKKVTKHQLCTTFSKLNSQQCKQTKTKRPLLLCLTLTLSSGLSSTADSLPQRLALPLLVLAWGCHITLVLHFQGCNLSSPTVSVEAVQSGGQRLKGLIHEWDKQRKTCLGQSLQNTDWCDWLPGDPLKVRTNNSQLDQYSVQGFPHPVMTPFLFLHLYFAPSWLCYRCLGLHKDNWT